MPALTGSRSGPTLTPPDGAMTHALTRHVERRERLAEHTPVPLPTADDLAGLLGALAATQQPVDTSAHDWQPDGDRRMFAVRFGLGGIRLTATDEARREKAGARAEVTRQAKIGVQVAMLLAGEDSPPATPTREVTQWSPKSRARMVEAFASLDYSPLQHDLPHGWVPGLVTLTYPGDWVTYAPDGATVKRHVRTLLERFKRAFGRRVRGVWKLEFQRRGAPHVHIYTAVPAVAPLSPSPFCADHSSAACLCRTFEYWLSSAWADIVGTPKDTVAYYNHWSAGTGVDFAETTKYTDPRRLGIYFLGHSTKAADGKEYQHRVPAAWQEPGKGPGRFWGYWGLDRPEVAVQISLADWLTLRRRLRKVLAGKARQASFDRALGKGLDTATAMRVPVTYARTLGVGGQMVGGFVLVNDAIRLAYDLARSLSLSR